jgi:hypothetical protein
MSNTGHNSYILDFLNIDLLLQKGLPNLFKLLTWRQNMTFWCFFIRRSVASNQFFCHYRPPKRGRSPAGPWSAVRCGTSQHSNQFLFPGPCRVQRDAGSQSGWSLAILSLLPHRYGQISETVAFLHTCQIAGEVSLLLVKARSKNDPTPAVYGLPGPRLK